MTHSFRKSALESEKVFRLLDDSISIKNLKTEEVKTMSYDRIASIKLGFIAKKSMPDDYYCRILTKSNNEIRIHSQHFKGLAEFIDRKITYTPFIIELHEHLADTNIPFTKGMNKVVYWIQILFFSLMGTIMLMAGLAALIPYGLFIILMLIYLFFRLKKHFVKNKPGTYRHDSLPTDLLP